jgi:signal transduction histidine kinase
VSELARRFSPTGWIRRRLASPPVRGRDRIIVLGGVAAAIVGVAIGDYASGVRVSLAALYLLPVIAATVAAGRRFGVLAAVMSAVLFALVDRFSTGISGVDAGINVFLRLLTYLLVVYLLAALVEASVAAQASDERSKRFLSTATHQLRTPLTGILATADALSLEADPGRRERLIRNLSVEVARTGRLVSRLLQISRLDRGENADLRPVELRELCEDEIDIASARLPDIEFRFLHPDADGPVMASIEGTREALSNLLDNAGRNAVSGVRVVLWPPADGQIRIDVTDDGPGLAAGTEEVVFERFVSLDGGGGAGLGLPIAREFMRGQGGDLGWVDGSFRLILPLRLPTFLMDRGSSTRSPSRVRSSSA